MTEIAQRKIDAKRGVDFIGTCCVFYCHDGEGNILLHKRSQACRDDQGKWDCGGGSMEHGESFDACVRREIKEEYGVDPIDVQFVDVVNVVRTHKGIPIHWIAFLHVAQVDPENVVIGEPDKMDDIGWFRVDEFPDEVHEMFLSHFDVVKSHIKNL